MGTEVKSEVTSYEARCSPSWRVNLLALDTKLPVLCIWWGDLPTKVAVDVRPLVYIFPLYNCVELSFCCIIFIPSRLFLITIRIKVSIYIRVNNPTLNQNIGKYNLSHIWDRVPFNTPGLKLGSSHETRT